ncbi:hypothetical protein M0R89_03235 [Halorussus limi]|uniref:Ig-like domain-containing protein n=1 Tax=Halorussus limi TaxID=2938695 RepID=A0A8U0HW75_9EURY|nr:hypothetical protein [Halorussus limi]UPV75089.1 hypothetical protein M0R89_03235 [Halorussus limi]
MGLRRRTLLRGTALAFVGTVAGCTRPGRNDFSVDDVSVSNETSSRSTVTVEARTDSESAFRETVTLDADESRRFANPLANDTSYEIRARVEGGPSGAYEWGGEHRDDRGVHVRVYSDRIEFQGIVH